MMELLFLVVFEKKKMLGIGEHVWLRWCARCGNICSKFGLIESMGDACVNRNMMNLGINVDGTLWEEHIYEKIQEVAKEAWSDNSYETEKERVCADGEKWGIWVIQLKRTEIWHVWIWCNKRVTFGTLWNSETNNELFKSDVEQCTETWKVKNKLMFLAVYYVCVVYLITFGDHVKQCHNLNCFFWMFLTYKRGDLSWFLASSHKFVHINLLNIWWCYVHKQVINRLYSVAVDTSLLYMPHWDLSPGSVVPTISAYTRWNCLATTDARKSRSTPILTVRCSFQRVFCLGSVWSGWTDP